MSIEYRVMSSEYWSGGEKDPLLRGEKRSDNSAAGCRKQGVCPFRGRTLNKIRSELNAWLTHPWQFRWTLNCLSLLKRGIYTITFIVVLLTQNLHAQQTEPVSAQYPQLEEYLRIATKENPELRALWHGYQAELETIPQVGTLPDPEVQIGFTFNPMTTEPFLGRFSASAMQMFPWFGTLKTKREMQRASAEVRYERLNSRQLALFRDIQRTWFDLSELNRKIAITRETLGLVQDLESLVEVRYETARAGQADLLRIQMEEQRLITLIENLEDRLNPMRARFNAYLNRESSAGVETTETIEPRQIQLNEEELRMRIRELNPEFSELDAREQMLREQRNLAELSGRPDFGIGVEVMGRNFTAMSMFPESGEMVSGMATIRIPLYRARYSARYRQAVEQLNSVEYLRTATDNRLVSELEEALEQYRESERSARLLSEELIPRARQAFKILSDEYSTGNVSFDEVLRIKEQLLDLELELIEVLVDQNKAVINIETLVGDVAPYQQTTEADE